jgi:KAP family P-loop domain
MAELPRQPVQLPRYVSDEVDGSLDLVGIGAETDAFARLVASCDLVPPLAVGLFGDWGSGKSFLIDAVKPPTGPEYADRAEGVPSRHDSDPYRRAATRAHEGRSSEVGSRTPTKYTTPQREGQRTTATTPTRSAFDQVRPPAKNTGTGQGTPRPTSSPPVRLRAPGA